MCQYDETVFTCGHKSATTLKSECEELSELLDEYWQLRAETDKLDIFELLSAQTLIFLELDEQDEQDALPIPEPCPLRRYDESNIKQIHTDSECLDCLMKWIARDGEMSAFNEWVNHHWAQSDESTWLIP